MCPYYKQYQPKYAMGDGDAGCDDELCPTDPDLILLRKNAKGEREAIGFYLKAAAMTGGELCELFLEIARDEMTHFRNTMRLLAKYDPMQARAFEEAGINMRDEERKPHQPEKCLDKHEAIDLITKAMADELSAINMYQLSYEKACHHDVKALFCQNANDEKSHVAELWRVLMIFTKESCEMPAE
jgi:rubrerythrin